MCGELFWNSGSWNGGSFFAEDVMHHPNGTWVTLPWGLPFQKLVAVPFPVQHPYHALQATPSAAPLITLHPATPGASATAALSPALQTLVPTAFSLQPQPLTIRQVRSAFEVFGEPALRNKRLWGRNTRRNSKLSLIWRNSRLGLIWRNFRLSLIWRNSRLSLIYIKILKIFF